MIPQGRGVLETRNPHQWLCVTGVVDSNSGPWDTRTCLPAHAALLPAPRPLAEGAPARGCPSSGPGEMELTQRRGATEQSSRDLTRPGSGMDVMSHLI